MSGDREARVWHYIYSAVACLESWNLGWALVEHDALRSAAYTALLILFVHRANSEYKAFRRAALHTGDA